MKFNNFVIMKYYSVGLVVSFSLLAFSLAAPSPSETKEDAAFRECNVTNPVRRNVRQIMDRDITTAFKETITQEEKCHLFCYLQKVGFFDENGNIKGDGLINHTLQQSPELSKYSEVIIAQVFQLGRVIKGFSDKCEKAFVAYHKYATGIFELIVADVIQDYSHIRDDIENEIVNGIPVDQNISQAVKSYLGYIDGLMLAADAKELQKMKQKRAQKYLSRRRSQLANAQSQASDAQSQGSAHATGIL